MKPELVEFKDGSYGVRVKRASNGGNDHFADLIDPKRVIRKPALVRCLGAGEKHEAQAALDQLNDDQVSCEVVK